MDLDSCQVVIKDIGPSKCWAGDEAPEFVLLMRTHQLHINPLPQVFPWSSQRPSCSSTCIGPAQSRLRPSSGALYSSGCMAPSKGFGRTGGHIGP